MANLRLNLEPSVSPAGANLRTRLWFRPSYITRVQALGKATYIPAPCIRICRLDDDDVCVGCMRSLDEICAWPDADLEERCAILDAMSERAKNKTVQD